MADEGKEGVDHPAPIGTFTIFENAEPVGLTLDKFQEFQEQMENLGLLRLPEEPGPKLALYALFAQFDRELAILLATGRLIALYVVLLIVVALLVYASFQLPDGLERSYAIEIASGVTFFLAVPLALVGLNGRFKGVTWLVCILIVAASVIGSFLSDGPLQSICIEATVGILLLIALDLLWAKVIERTRKALANARAEA